MDAGFASEIVNLVIYIYYCFIVDDACLNANKWSCMSEYVWTFWWLTSLSVWLNVSLGSLIWEPIPNCDCCSLVLIYQWNRKEHWKKNLGRIDFCVESYRVIESSRIKYLQDSRPESFWYYSTIHGARWKFSRWKTEYINKLYYIIFDKDG